MPYRWYLHIVYMCTCLRIYKLYGYKHIYMNVYIYVCVFVFPYAKNKYINNTHICIYIYYCMHKFLWFCLYTYILPKCMRPCGGWQIKYISSWTLPKNMSTWKKRGDQSSPINIYIPFHVFKSKLQENFLTAKCPCYAFSSASMCHSPVYASICICVCAFRSVWVNMCIYRLHVCAKCMYDHVCK